MIASLAFTKSRAWRFQQEWRIAATASSFAFPSEALRRVILGYRFPEQQFAGLQEVLSRGGYRVAIEQVQRMPGSFALTTSPRGAIT